jgi:NAD(P)H-dependent FMN reductase
MSGVLKNALDLLDADQVAGKVVGAISVLGGPANSNAVNDVARIMRWLHAWVIPRQITVGRASTVFVDGQILDESLRRRFERFAETLAWSALRIADSDTCMSATSSTDTCETTLPRENLVGAW